MKIKNFKKLFTLSFVLTFSLLSVNVESNEFGISDQKFQEIESRINSMSLEQLNARRTMLLDEQDVQTVRLAHHRPKLTD